MLHLSYLQGSGPGPPPFPVPLQLYIAEIAFKSAVEKSVLPRLSFGYFLDCMVYRLFLENSVFL